MLPIHPNRRRLKYRFSSDNYRMPKIAYGSEELDFTIEPSDCLTEREPTYDFPLWNPDKLLDQLEADRFGGFSEGEKILIIVNDAHRSTPTGEILFHLTKQYPDMKADFIVACGNHPAPSPEELARIFGRYDLPGDAKVLIHDSKDQSSLKEIGEIDGHKLQLNKHLFEYDKLVVIGSVEPHYFAGFTGGRKAFLPGLADFDSIRRNHAKAVSMEAQPMALSGNPVAEDMQKFLDLAGLPDLYSIQAVIGRNHDLIDCFCGDIAESFEQAVELAEKIYSFATNRQFDLVLAELGPPLDRNLYQLQKALENCHAAVRDGGTIVAISKCVEGVGNDEFYHLAGRLQDGETVLSHAGMTRPPMGIHKLSRVVKMGKRISVKALTGLKREIVEQVFIEPAVSIEAEMQKLRSEEDQPLDILLVRDAGLMAVRVTL